MIPLGDGGGVLAGAPQAFGAINIGVLDTNPAGNLGDFYYNSTSNTVRIYGDGGWVPWAYKSGGAVLDSTNTFTAGFQIIKTGLDGSPGLDIWRNSATQSANLFSLYQSTGTNAMAFFGPNGNLAIRNDNGAAATTPLSITAHATQSVNLFQILASDNSTVRAAFSSAGALTVSPSSGTAATINAASSAVGLAVRYSGTGTENLIQWLNSDGTTVIGRITSAGRIQTNNGAVFGSTASSGPAITSAYAGAGTNIGLAVIGATNQTADLFRMQGDTGTVLGGRNALAQVWSGSTSPVLVATGGAATGASSGTTATITTTSAHGLAVGDLVTVASMSVAGYNGTFLIATVPTTTTFTYTTSGSNIGAGTGGTVSVPAQASFTARSAGTVGMVVRGAASATANIAAFQTSSSTILTIDNTGALSSTANISTGANLRVGSQNIGLSGSGIMALANAGTVPSANPTAGGYLYSEGGALKWRGSSGTVTTIAVA